MPSAKVADEWPSTIAIPSEPLGCDGASEEPYPTIEPLKSSPGGRPEPREESPEKSPDDETKNRNRELVRRLIVKRCDLEETLLAKLNELKQLCVSEGELTGELPKEIFATLLPGEDEPRVQRRVGTAFKFSQEQLEQLCCGRESSDRLTQLQADIQLHRKIVAAAERLAKDKNTNKSVRKKRRKDFQAAAHKLKAMERGLLQLRLAGSRSELLMNRSIVSITPGVYDTISSTSSVAIASAPTAMIGGTRTSGQLSREASGSGFSLHSLKSWSTNLVASSSQAFKGSTKSVPEICSASASANAAVADDCDSQISFPTADIKSSALPPSSTITSPTRLFGGKKKSPAMSLSQAKSQKASMTASTSTTSSGTSSSASSGFFSRLSSMASVNINHNGPLSARPLLLSPPPAIPARRPSLSRTPSGNGDTPNSQTRGDNGGYNFAIAIRDSPEYANIGYTSSAPYKSAYRQSNFPTIAASQSSNLNSVTSFPAGKPLRMTTNVKTDCCPLLLSSQAPRYPTPAHIAHLRAPQLLVESFNDRIGRAGFTSGIFSTSSLDRRALLTTNAMHRVRRGEQGSQHSTHFPVNPVNDIHPNAMESAGCLVQHRPPMDLRRFGKSISASTPGTNGGSRGGHAYLPSTDPEMERLLASIHNRTANDTKREGLISSTTAI